MKLKNKKGFTLVELLAVIVILAVIILIASSNVGTMMTNARKNALAIEGNTLITAAKNAYQMAILNAEVTGTEQVCFALSSLKSSGYFEKADSKYKGSVLLKPDAKGVITYKFWISNGSYVISNADTGATGSSANPISQTNPEASENCAGAGRIVVAK